MDDSRLLLGENLESSSGRWVARSGEDDCVRTLGEGLDGTEADSTRGARESASAVSWEERGEGLTEVDGLGEHC